MQQAGWRGLDGRVIAAGVRAVRDLMPSTNDLLEAAIGPGAGRCCYEVGRRAARADSQAYPGARAPATISTSRRSPAAQLAAAGVRTVHDLGMCTICVHRSCSTRIAAMRGCHRTSGGCLAWLT